MKNQPLFFTLAVTFLFSSSTVFATDRLVPAPYATIQAAIDAAVNGDTVIVADGTYIGTGNRNIDFKGKAITVRSQNGPQSCIIDCQGSIGWDHRGFYFHSGEGTNSVLSGFTIKGGYVGDEPGYGGGIYCVGSSPTIQNCIIRSNKVEGILANSYGGGIACVSGSSPVLIDCVISTNESRGGDGFLDWQSISDGRDGFGGGIYSGSGCNPTIINCLIMSNRAEGGKGGDAPEFLPEYAYGGGDAKGGALYCNSATISNCTIINNTVVPGQGGWGDPPGPDGLAVCGGIYGSGTTTISDCIIWGNGDDLYNCSATYSCIEDSDAGTGNISSNPLFAAGPLGNYYLSQTLAGQAANSPCVNAGSVTAVNRGMDDLTTRTDQFKDKGVVDIGYHYPITPGSADIDKNLHVDFVDFALLAADWLACSDSSWLAGDITRDECVDANDLDLLTNCWLDNY